MLELKNVSIALLKNGRKIVENFTFALNAGERAVIIGEEGNGKSTLLKYVYNAELVDSYCDAAGAVIKKGVCAYLPQLMDEALNCVPLCEYFADENLALHAGMLAKLGISRDFLESHQLMGTLSGGEKVKVQTAKLLMGEPDILLLDEPTNDLDIETLEWLERFIAGTRLPVLFVSHDETLIERCANVIIHMEQLHGKRECRISVARCGYREYLSTRRGMFAKQAQVAQKQRDDYDKQMERWQQIYNKVEKEQRNISRQDPSGGRVLKKKMKSVLAQGRRFEREAEDFTEFPVEEDAILTSFDENISIPSGKVVLDFALDELRVGERLLSREVRLFVSGSEHIGIVGRNGSGKSTLLAQLWELLESRRDLRCSYMPQDYSESLDYSLSPVEYLAAHYSKDEVTKARTYMGSMRFTRSEMTGRIGALSGGQRAKILFLDMVLKNANVLVLDEPTRNFSPLSGPVIRRALKNYGGAIISVSHDRKYLEEVCDKVYVLDENGLTEQSYDISE